MALDPNRLKNKIAGIMEEMLTRENTSIDEFSTRLAIAIVEEIKESTIIYTSGLTAPNGPVAGTFIGGLT
ncbi:MAG: hypothetical protein WCY77_10295 [Weeksellaceae bacterium]